MRREEGSMEIPALGLLMDFHSVTDDGFEAHFGTNHLGHFLLTLLLLPIMIKSGPSRIINVSSSGHKYCDSLYFEALNMEKNYNPSTPYGRSKLANILFTLELAKRLEGTEVKAVTLHPGVVYTEISRNLFTFKAFTLIWLISLLQKFGSLLLKSPEQ
nr:retinol dehydrogenase 12-like [Halyomorpha halys]